ncbi:hypothetical protein AVEN_182747-1 [Araneus ventricosus]|uniref:CRAL-TRIO domain-containing protein n=1 Tax=Araneus ventricosus TaxID=182803 RepID=A0A4Y2N689_ARAVE|nr:hypothetical protein AVEN_182747-1 [Araneus ventricosus]
MRTKFHRIAPDYRLLWQSHFILVPHYPRYWVFVHPNDQWKSLHSVIPPEVLPEEYGGKLKFDSCINLLEDIEELEDYFHEIFKFGYLKTKAGRESFRPICRKN